MCLCECVFEDDTESLVPYVFAFVCACVCLCTLPKSSVGLVRVWLHDPNKRG